MCEVSRPLVTQRKCQVAWKPLLGIVTRHTGKAVIALPRLGAVADKGVHPLILHRLPVLSDGRLDGPRGSDAKGARVGLEPGVPPWSLGTPVGQHDGRRSHHVAPVRADVSTRAGHIHLIGDTLHTLRVGVKVLGPPGACLLDQPCLREPFGRPSMVGVHVHHHKTADLAGDDTDIGGGPAGPPHFDLQLRWKPALVNGPGLVRQRVSQRTLTYPLTFRIVSPAHHEGEH